MPAVMRKINWLIKSKVSYKAQSIYFSFYLSSSNDKALLLNSKIFFLDYLSSDLT